MFRTSILKDEFLTKIFGESPILICHEVNQVFRENLDDLSANFLNKINNESLTKLSPKKIGKMATFIKNDIKDEIESNFRNFQTNSLLKIFNLPSDFQLPVDENFDKIKNCMFDEFLESSKNLALKEKLLKMGKEELDEESAQLDECLKSIDMMFDQINEIASTNFEIHDEENLVPGLLNQLEKLTDRRASLSSSISDLVN